VDMVDVATPATFERYTGNWKASYMGWLFTPQMMMTQMSKTLPGLGNFYMIGQWVGASSLPFAATSGRHVTQIICHKDKKPFVTTVPEGQDGETPKGGPVEAARSGPWVDLDLSLCTGAAKCADVCPVGVYRVVDGKVDTDNIDVCVECGACQGVCPTGAILRHWAWG
jgi:ferredoxin